MSAPEDNEEIVLVLTKQECAAVCVAATGFVMLGFAEPTLLVNVATVIARINEAMGNPTSDSFARDIEGLKERIAGEGGNGP